MTPLLYGLIAAILAFDGYLLASGVLSNTQWTVAQNSVYIMAGHIIVVVYLINYKAWAKDAYSFSLGFGIVLGWLAMSLHREWFTAMRWVELSYPSLGQWFLDNSYFLFVPLSMAVVAAGFHMRIFLEDRLGRLWLPFWLLGALAVFNGALLIYWVA